MQTDDVISHLEQGNHEGAAEKMRKYVDGGSRVLMSSVAKSPDQIDEATGIFDIFLMTGANRDVALRTVSELYPPPRVTAELARCPAAAPVSNAWQPTTNAPPGSHALDTHGMDGCT